MEALRCDYILASQFRGTIYIGVTTDLVQRIREHRYGRERAFTGRYAVYRLVHVELFEEMVEARRRERQLKRWHRSWKISLIEETNPHWDDLAIPFGFERLLEPKLVPSG